MSPIEQYRSLLSRPGTRWLIIGLTALYLISPIDLIPEFIPFLGVADDGAILAIVLGSLLQYYLGTRSSSHTDTTSKPNGGTIIDVEANRKEQ